MSDGVDEILPDVRFVRLGPKVPNGLGDHDVNARRRLRCTLVVVADERDNVDVPSRPHEGGCRAEAQPDQ